MLQMQTQEVPGKPNDMKMKKTVVIAGAGVGLGNHIAEKF